jgi:hypothetical protein
MESIWLKSFAILITSLFIAKKLAEPRVYWVQKYDRLINLIIFSLVILIIGADFMLREKYLFIIPLLMGMITIIYYFYDE